jgi:hypothetical protein
MKKTTILMAAVLALTTVLVAGITVLTGSVQEAQANPCSTYYVDGTAPVGPNIDAEYNCDFEGIGSLEIDQDESMVTVD